MHIEQSANEKVKYVLKSRHFVISYAMMFLGVLYFQYVTTVFKPFGEAYGHSD